MFNPFNHPILVLLLSLPAFWISARIGAAFKKRQRDRENDGNDDFDILLGATLTLLALIIGFTFSMAVSRYDQRKNLEEQEANAIGTEYVRAHLLPAADAARVRGLLTSYLDQRILFYKSQTGNRFGRSTPKPLSCRPRCGPRSRRPLLRSLRPWRPSSLLA